MYLTVLNSEGLLTLTLMLGRHDERPVFIDINANVDVDVDVDVDVPY